MLLLQAAYGGVAGPDTFKGPMEKEAPKEVTPLPKV